MVTDLLEIRRLAGSKMAENLDFRRYLKKHHIPEEPFHILAARIERQVDCTRCANCCRQTIVNVTDDDLSAIAAHLGMPLSEVLRQAVTADPDEPGRRLLINRNDACIFLEGNLCLVYDARPRVCRDFPHLARKSVSLGSRMSSVCRRTEVCPIAYNVLEEYKRLVGYHPPGHAA